MARLARASLASPDPTQLSTPCQKLENLRAIPAHHRHSGHEKPQPRTGRTVQGRRQKGAGPANPPETVLEPRRHQHVKVASVRGQRFLRSGDVMVPRRGRTGREGEGTKARPQGLRKQERGRQPRGARKGYVIPRSPSFHLLP